MEIKVDWTYFAQLALKCAFCEFIGRYYTVVLQIKGVSKSMKTTCQ